MEIWNSITHRIYNVNSPNPQLTMEHGWAIASDMTQSIKYCHVSVNSYFKFRVHWAYITINFMYVVPWIGLFIV